MWFFGRGLAIPGRLTALASSCFVYVSVYLLDSPLILYIGRLEGKRNQKSDNEVGGGAGRLQDFPRRHPKLLVDEHECNTGEEMRPLILCRLRIQAGNWRSHAWIRS